MPPYVEVIINLPGIEGVFDYHLPEELQDTVQSGMLVMVPFGKQTVQGIVNRFIEVPQVQKTKAVISVLDPEPVVTPQQQALAAWLSRESFANLAACYQLMLPPGLSQQADSLYSIRNLAVAAPLSPLQRRLVERIEERGPQRGRQLEAAFRRLEWKEAARRLVRREILEVEPYLPAPRVRPKMVRTVQLAVDPGRIPERLAEIGRAGTAADRRAAVMDFLVKEPWEVEVSVVYGMTGAKISDLKKLEDAGLLRFGESESLRDPLERYDWITQAPPTLTRDQTSVWGELESVLDSDQWQKPVLLHGVTGSGKTEIYLRAVQKTLNRGKQAIVLVPEISLTPQTVQRFHTRFPGKVGIIHSKLSEGERYDTWRRARSGDLAVIVGPRSALFTPLKQLGLIVVDEVHDGSYYQDDFQPHYNAVRAVEQYGSLAQAHVIYGSATPNVEMVYRAEKENWPRLHLPGRILAHRKAVNLTVGTELETDGEAAYLPLPQVEVVDMRTELKAGNRSIFSRALQAAIEEVLVKKQQAILFLNRRGSATYVFCRDCGYKLTCPKCEIPLTFHAENQKLICHLCSYQRNMPLKCPQCGSTRIRQFGTGTEKVEEEARKAFPDARVLRMDSGVTRQKNAHETILRQFAARQADILVGTQMLAKGIDLPFVTLVGVVLADVGLNLPDFRAPERTFQLLTQVSGRAGRSPLGGKVVFQTYQPDAYAIQSAARHDFKGFYRQELSYRLDMAYPPYSRLIRLEFRDHQETAAQSAAEKMGAMIRQWIDAGNFKQSELIGPVPCFYRRVSGIYRWQIVLRGPNPQQILRERDLGDAVVTVDPVNLL